MILSENFGNKTDTTWADIVAGSTWTLSATKPQQALSCCRCANAANQYLMSQATVKASTEWSLYVKVHHNQGVDPNNGRSVFGIAASPAYFPNNAVTIFKFMNEIRLRTREASSVYAWILNESKQSSIPGIRGMMQRFIVRKRLSPNKVDVYLRTPIPNGLGDNYTDILVASTASEVPDGNDDTYFFFRCDGTWKVNAAAYLDWVQWSDNPDEDFVDNPFPSETDVDFTPAVLVEKDFTSDAPHYIDPRHEGYSETTAGGGTISIESGTGRNGRNALKFAGSAENDAAYLTIPALVDEEDAAASDHRKVRVWLKLNTTKTGATTYLDGGEASGFAVAGVYDDAGTPAALARFRLQAPRWTYEGYDYDETRLAVRVSGETLDDGETYHFPHITGGDAGYPPFSLPQDAWFWLELDICDSSSENVLIRAGDEYGPWGQYTYDSRFIGRVLTHDLLSSWAGRKGNEVRVGFGDLVANASFEMLVDSIEMFTGSTGGQQSLNTRTVEYADWKLRDAGTVPAKLGRYLPIVVGADGSSPSAAGWKIDSTTPGSFVDVLPQTVMATKLNEIMQDENLTPFCMNMAWPPAKHRATRCLFRTYGCRPVAGQPYMQALRNIDGDVTHVGDFCKRLFDFAKPANEVYARYYLYVPSPDGADYWTTANGDILHYRDEWYSFDDPGETDIFESLALFSIGLGILLEGSREIGVEMMTHANGTLELRPGFTYLGTNEKIEKTIAVDPAPNATTITLTTSDLLVNQLARGRLYVRTNQAGWGAGYDDADYVRFTIASNTANSITIEAGSAVKRVGEANPTVQADYTLLDMDGASVAAGETVEVPGFRAFSSEGIEIPYDELILVETHYYRDTGDDSGYQEVWVNGDIANKKVISATANQVTATVSMMEMHSNGARNLVNGMFYKSAHAFSATGTGYDNYSYVSAGAIGADEDFEAVIGDPHWRSRRWRLLEHAPALDF